jgi:precorrin-2/cobalt-factor-2 C20-methyltransferase
MSILYAIGVGPGDPELLTLKGARLLREADVVIAPVADPGGSSVAHAIIHDLLDPSRQQVVTQVFPMRRESADLEEIWAQSAVQVAGFIRSGKTVAFVTLGDPSLYSTFQYLYRHLKRLCPDVPVEIVPGVSSINAASALADLPLGLGDERLAILSATSPPDVLQRAFEDFDTIVLMKVHRVFVGLRDLLAAAGLKEKAVFLKRVGLPGQAVFQELDSVGEGDLDYFSLLIVRK